MHSCKLDYYADVKNVPWSECDCIFSRWFEFSYSVLQCCKQHFVDKTFNFIPALFEGQKIARECWFLNPMLFHMPSDQQIWPCVFTDVLISTYSCACTMLNITITYLSHVIIIIIIIINVDNTQYNFISINTLLLCPQVIRCLQIE